MRSFAQLHPLMVKMLEKVPVTRNGICLHSWIGGSVNQLCCPGKVVLRLDVSRNLNMLFHVKSYDYMILYVYQDAGTRNGFDSQQKCEAQ